MNLSDFKVAKQKFEKNSKQILLDELQTFFDANPDIDALRWAQYTPHFNDGDVCEFSRHEFDVRGNVAELLFKAEDLDEDGFCSGWDIDTKSELRKTLNKLETACEDTDDLFKAAFGDGVQVIATRKGFKVTDYDHD